MYSIIILLSCGKPYIQTADKFALSEDRPCSEIREKAEKREPFHRLSHNL